MIKSKLTGHMARCNFRPPAVPYYSRNLHLDIEKEEGDSKQPVELKLGKRRPAFQLSKISLQELMSVISKVEGVMTTLAVEEAVVERIRFNKGMDREVKEASKSVMIIFFFIRLFLSMPPSHLA